MKKTIGTVTLVLTIVSVGYFAATRHGGSVRATDDDPHPCDTEAAHPSDPQRFGPGRMDEEIVPVLGVRACQEAVSQFPNQPRFQFQLGRALLMMKRSDEAREAFLAASAMGNKPANLYLAEGKIRAYWATESDTDLEEAIKLLTASATWFAPAEQRLGQLTFNADHFTSPELVQALYDGDFERLNQARMVVAVYLRGVHDFLATEFNPEDNECPAYVVDPSITFELDRAVAGDPRNTIEGAGYTLAMYGAGVAGKLILDPTWKGDRQKWTDFYRDLGRRDGQFMAHHYGCSSPVTERLYKHIVEFSKVKRPLSEYAEGLLHGQGMDLFVKSAQSAK